jgi:SRSO17 transposase
VRSAYPLVVITSTVGAMMAAVAGLSEKRLARVRGRLEAFVGEVFAGAVQRSEQRKWAGVYLRGLMLEGRRKSIEPMAARLGDGDEQCLQQFVNQSPWRERVVRANLARRMSVELAPEAWIVDDTGFPKKGRFSVGVARQYSGTLGRIDNCQLGVSISAATDAASCPLDWRIYLPAEWDQDVERRGKAHVPDDVRHRAKWQLALDMVDELCGWGLAPPVLCADAGYGEITAFRQGLDDRRVDYIVQVKAGTSAYPLAVEPQLRPWKGRGRRPMARYRAAPSSLRELALQAGGERAVEVTWRQGSRGPMRSRFVALRIRPANIGLRRAAADTQTELPVRWLLAEWPAGAEEPTDYWLSSLPEHTPVAGLVRLGKLRWRIEHDYRELKDALGLDHFEGRSYRGWHHHVTLVSVAHAFLTLERQRPRLGAAA